MSRTVRSAPAAITMPIWWRSATHRLAALVSERIALRLHLGVSTSKVCL